MKKYVLDLTVTENIRLHANYVLIKLTQSDPLPEMLPGQFAEIRVDGSPTTFLRRPISINYVDRKTNEVWFLVQLVGDGTRKLATVQKGEYGQCRTAFGQRFLHAGITGEEVLLIGGGVGTAPMLYLGEALLKAGCKYIPAGCTLQERSVAVRPVCCFRRGSHHNRRRKHGRKRLCNYAQRTGQQPV